MQLNLTLICFVFGGFLPDAAARREQMDTGQCDLPRSVSRAARSRGEGGRRGARRGAAPRGAADTRGPAGVRGCSVQGVRCAGGGGGCACVYSVGTGCSCCSVRVGLCWRVPQRSLPPVGCLFLLRCLLTLCH